MRVYNLYPRKKEFSFGSLPVVEVGEEGRGRKLVYIPCPEKISPDSHYEVGTTRSLRPKIVKAKTPSSGWIAKLSGEGVYTRGTYGTVYVPRQYASQVKVLAHGWGAYGAAGRIGEYHEFIVEIKSPFPVIFRVRPAGGRHKLPCYWLVFDEETVTKVTDEEYDLLVDQRDDLPPREELVGEVVDSFHGTTGENLVDLVDLMA